MSASDRADLFLDISTGSFTPRCRSSLAIKQDQLSETLTKARLPSTHKPARKAHFADIAMADVEMSDVPAGAKKFDSTTTKKKFEVKKVRSIVPTGMMPN